MNTAHSIRKFFQAVKSVCRSGVRFIYHAWIAPRSQEEDTKRKEFILNILLLLFIPFLSLLDLFVVVAAFRQGIHHKGFSPFALTSIVLLFAWLLVVSRKSYYRLASWIMLSILFIATTYGAARWGVELPLVAISYILIIVISSILISIRFSFLTTFIIGATIITICELQIKGIISPSLEWKNDIVHINDAIQLTIAFLVITGASWLSNREIEHSLRRARTSESLLRKERDQLEVTVEERTKEVRAMQEEKITQLYRFAEFGRLSSGVFHDLMNSLQSLTVHVDRIPDNPETVPEVQDHLEKAVIASKRMGSYLQNIRKQLIAEDIVTTFSIQGEIENAIDILKFKSRSANVDIAFTTKADAAISLYGNGLRFYQIMVNLIGNAIEACEENDIPGKILITLVQNKNNTITITIEDNGHGIPLEIQNVIFNAFFSTKYQKGIGLGLSQTKEFIGKDFGGTISVESKKHHTVFTIIIPLNNPGIRQ